MKIVIFPNETRDKGFVITRQVCRILEDAGCCCVCVGDSPVPDLSREMPEQAARDAALVLCIGGDGTFLRAVSLPGVGELPLAGVNTGHTGFLSQYTPDRLEELQGLAQGRFGVSKRLMLNACARDVKGNTRQLTALNELVISRGETAQTVTLDVDADGQPLGSFMADGLLVATPTGSTAYNLSAGGPVADASVDAMLVTPICPHTVWARSFVLSADRVLCVRQLSARANPARLSADGGEPLSLGGSDVVTIRRSERQALVIVPEGRHELPDVKHKLLRM